VSIGALALSWRAQARSAKHSLDAREGLCKTEVAAAIRRVRVLSEEKLRLVDACDRWSGLNNFEAVYWPMTACFGTHGDWSNYRGHFEAALILGDRHRLSQVLDGLEVALEGARFNDVRYPSLGPPPKVPLCMNFKSD
jgi:hypothetical protein